ncbi:uncharacterized protein MYCFIDRAFT_176061 [Pseudocercospora fijiensis CIRAD86]|uniref:Uncharacterized protein n=1 Tax=Pseudocercospora fijiensis (strain CIRAD86) TaxID=383855 RepID=M2YXV1_PSEFD|nr:uncharacterized protein MYCFIDRAFT_176061 [Pseudocercospora fijiensis CIRAD86]EME82515.1 hypothetical protein MYCFIDRAFT_176061 [Pseudocercospora fijiensis CIRAD86]
MRTLGIMYVIAYTHTLQVVLDEFGTENRRMNCGFDSLDGIALGFPCPAASVDKKNDLLELLMPDFSSLKHMIDRAYLLEGSILQERRFDFHVSQVLTSNLSLVLSHAKGGLDSPFQLVDILKLDLDTSEHTKSKQKKSARQVAAAPPQASGQGAVGRVFGIPELLQDILVQRAATDVGQSHAALPVKALFVWQRVNCTFRNTIRESPKLRQYMLLAPLDSDISREVGPRKLGNLQALRCAFGDYDSDQRGWCKLLPPGVLKKAAYDMPTINLGSRNTKKLPWKQARLSKAFHFVNASWRDIKLRVSRRGLRIRQWVTDDLRSCVWPAEWEAAFGYVCDFVIKHDMKLGDFVKAVSQVRSRNYETHMARCLWFVCDSRPSGRRVTTLRQRSHRNGIPARLPDQRIAKFVELSQEQVATPIEIWHSRVNELSESDDFGVRKELSCIRGSMITALESTTIDIGSARDHPSQGEQDILGRGPNSREIWYDSERWSAIWLSQVYNLHRLAEREGVGTLYQAFKCSRCMGVEWTQRTALH